MCASKGLKSFCFSLSALQLKLFMAMKSLLWNKNMNGLSVLELCVANWKLFGVFVSTAGEHALICRGILVTWVRREEHFLFSAILNVCLSALLDWGHIVQHLTGLSPRCWAELKSLWQLCTSMGTPAQGDSLRNAYHLDGDRARAENTHQSVQSKNWLKERSSLG